MFRRVLATVPSAAGRTLSASRSARPSTTTFTATRAVAAGRRQYHEKVLDHYSRPRNVGSMSKTDTDVGTGLVGAPACGDVMKLQIRVDPSNNTISDVKFKTFGCGSAIASSSYLTELVRGMTLEEASRVRNTEIAKELCLPPVKRKILDKIYFPECNANMNSALFNVGRGCHQICHLKLLHQEPKCKDDELGWYWLKFA